MHAAMMRTVSEFHHDAHRLIPDNAQAKKVSELARSGCTRLLAIRFESFVESDAALRSLPVERQREEDLLWHALKHQSRHVGETEFPVVIRMSNKTTSLRIHGFQP